jgi:hypothetical protein
MEDVQQNIEANLIKIGLILWMYVLKNVNQIIKAQVVDHIKDESRQRHTVVTPGTGIKHIHEHRGDQGGNPLKHLV